MRWVVDGTRTLYADQWIRVDTSEVTLPGGQRLDHRSVHRGDGAFTLVLDQGRALLLWRHRFITDTWGWELPGGTVGDGERPADAAVRETIEETGWRPTGPLTLLLRVQPMPGLFAAHHHVYLADGATLLGPPVDDFESERIAWVDLGKVPRMIEADEIGEATTQLALLHAIFHRAGVLPDRS